MNDCVYLFTGKCPCAILKMIDKRRCSPHCPKYISANSDKGSNMMEVKK